MPTSRIPSQQIARSFGLVAIVENMRVVLPLKAVECEFSVVAGLVEVRMTQVFRQENPKPLDCDYLFPLPADASVYSCEADFNGRIIRAKVKERGEAVRLAQEKKAEGRRVALVEAERENLFTLTLSNLQPDDLVLVTLRYIQPLRHLADLTSVEIPFCPGIRYIPGKPLIRSNRGQGIMDDTDQVPDASRISPVRMEKEHPDAAFIEIQGRLDAQYVEAGSLASPSHNIIGKAIGAELEVGLFDKGEVPDRDFVLRWKESNPEHLAARAWIQPTGKETYALLEIRAPKASGPPAPMDFYFLVDHSGSMGGDKWQKAALAVQTSVAKLIEGDRVMLTLFSNLPKDFAEQPLPPAALLGDPNFQQLEKLQPHGGTELGGALRHVLELAAAHSPNRKQTLVLITDAQVGNETAILKIMAAAPAFAVHCFGMDWALNDALLLALARQQQGTFHSLNPADDVVKVVSELAATIRHPVLHALRLPDGWEPSVTSLPSLFSEQVLYVSARSNRLQPLALAARNGNGQPVELPVVSQSVTGAAPYLHWCKNRIERLMQERNQAEAIALSVQSNLICPWTAFIAWDESEKVPVASHSLAQPNFIELNEELKLCAPAAHGRVLRYERRRSFNGMFEALADMFPKPRKSRMPAAGPAYMLGSGGPQYSPAQEPPYKTVIEDIVLAATAKFARMPATPHPHPQERTVAYDACFREICQRCGLRGYEETWRQIMHWAFADPQCWLKRSTLVAMLLQNLLKLADQQQQAFEALCRQLVQLERKHGKSAETVLRLRSAIVARSWTEVELAQRLETEFQERVDSRLVADYVRTSEEFRKTIEAFVQQYFKP